MGSPKSHIKFIKGFMTNPRDMGSVIPSSETLAKAMFKDLDTTHYKLAVEFGPGTGVLTRAAQKILPSGCQVLLIEKNADFIQLLRDRFLEYQVIEGDAQNVASILGPKAGEVDLIFSGLPFTNFPRDLSSQILQESAKVLKDGGHFRTFIYQHNIWLPKIAYLREQLQSTFSKVTSDPIYRNFPPAFIFDCIK